MTVFQYFLSRCQTPPQAFYENEFRADKGQSLSAHKLIQDNCTKDNWKRKTPQPGRADIFEQASVLLMLHWMRPQQGTTVSSVNSSVYQ